MGGGQNQTDSLKPVYMQVDLSLAKWALPCRSPRLENQEKIVPNIFILKSKIA
jgi:hypothetical protein